MNETPDTTCPHCNGDLQVCPHCLVPLQPPAARGKRSTLITLLIAVNVLFLLILLGGGTFGAWWYYTSPSTADTTPIQADEPSVAVPSTPPPSTAQSAPELLQTQPSTNLPLVNISISSRTIEEGGASTTVTTSLSRIHDSDVSVKLLLGGTANRATGAGIISSSNGEMADYTLSADTINIPAGYRSWATQITATADTNIEKDETIVIKIGAVTNASRGDVSQVIVTIAQTEPTPILILVSNPIVIREAGVPAQVAVVTTASISVDFEVSLSFAGSAKFGRDYHVDTRSIRVPAGSQTGPPITITAIPDSTIEHEETILVGIQSIATENHAIYICNKVEHEPGLLGDRWQPGAAAVNLAGLEHSALQVTRPACLMTDYRTIIIRDATIPSQENVSQDPRIN